MNFVYWVMISTNQTAYFKHSALFWRRWMPLCCYVFVSLRACSLLRSKGKNFGNTFNCVKVTIWLVNLISTEHDQLLELSDSLCNSVNSGLNLVRLIFACWLCLSEFPPYVHALSLEVTALAIKLLLLILPIYLNLLWQHVGKSLNAEKKYQRCPGRQTFLWVTWSSTHLNGQFFTCHRI